MNEIQPAVSPALDPEEKLDARRLVLQVLARLPERHRSVLVLHEGEEQTVPEIAELLGIPAGTVASRLRRAREEMKASLLRARSRNPGLGGLP